MHHDATETSSVKVMEAAKAHFESGRADLVIAELAPLLLEEAGAPSKGPLSKPKSILEGLQVLQVGLSRMPCVRHKVFYRESMPAETALPSHYLLTTAFRIHPGSTQPAESLC